MQTRAFLIVFKRGSDHWSCFDPNQSDRNLPKLRYITHYPPVNGQTVLIPLNSATCYTTCPSYLRWFYHPFYPIPSGQHDLNQSHRGHYLSPHFTPLLLKATDGCRAPTCAKSTSRFTQEHNRTSPHNLGPCYSLQQWHSTPFVRVLPDVFSFQLCIPPPPQVVGV
jgi:hypothetical protein